LGQAWWGKPEVCRVRQCTGWQEMDADAL